MSAYSDEIVSAFVDGELAASLIAEIETAAKSDSELAARIESARRGDAILREAFDEALAGDAPDFLAVVPQTDNVVPFARRAPPRPAVARWVPVAAAASVAFVIGAMAMQAYNPSPVLTASNGGLAADARIATALSRIRSGDKTAIDGGTMTVSLSFRAADRRLCREFELNFAQGAAMGVACRDDGVWRVEGLTAAPAHGGDFQTAGGPDDAALMLVMKRLGTGDTSGPRGRKRRDPERVGEVAVKTNSSGAR